MNIILSGYTTSRLEAPYEDSSYEVWTLNDAWRFCPRVDRIYELHRPEERSTYEGHEEYLANTDAKVVAFWPEEDWANVEQYPILEVLGKFRPYFTNSVSWILAHILAEGEYVEKIWLAGFNFATTHEHVLERCCVEYWIGLCEGDGIEVVLPDASNLLNATYLYGIHNYARVHQPIYEVKENVVRNMVLDYLDGLDGEKNARDVMKLLDWYERLR